jgi:hypothetical protein
VKLATLLAQVDGRPLVLCPDVYAEIARDYIEEVVRMARGESDRALDLESELADAEEDRDASDEDNRRLRGEIHDLRADIDRLKEENATLRARMATEGVHA